VPFVTQPSCRTTQAEGDSPDDLTGARTEPERAMEVGQATVGPDHPLMGFGARPGSGLGGMLGAMIPGGTGPG
jgi:hypothetical protein